MVRKKSAHWGCAGQISFIRPSTHATVAATLASKEALRVLTPPPHATRPDATDRGYSTDSNVPLSCKHNCYAVRLLHVPLQQLRPHPSTGDPAEDSSAAAHRRFPRRAGQRVRFPSLRWAASRAGTRGSAWLQELPEWRGSGCFWEMSGGGCAKRPTVYSEHR